MIDIVLMAGQSNMFGWKTSAEDMPPRWRGQIEDSMVWQDGAWAPLRVEGGYQKKGYGPELSFANDFTSDEGIPLGIVKVARNGSYLAKEWDPEAEGGLLEALIEQARAAMTVGPCRLRGLLWMQGEADASREKDARQYRARFERLIEKVRARLGCPDLPVIAGLIDPPADDCPHAEVVRQALANNSLALLQTVDCRGLPKRRDGLHFDKKGISILGRRFAAALSEISQAQDAPLTRQWIWNSDQYQVWYEGPVTNADDVVVTYPHAVKDHGFEEPGFGQTYFSKKGIAAVHILSNKSDWFQNGEIFDVIGAIRTYLKNAVQIVAYGASMGAYGALLTSKALEADKVIAIAPQFSIDRSIVPWEVRWKAAARRIGTFRHDMTALSTSDALKYVVYDPLSLDRAQIEMFEKDETWRAIQLPMASHQVLQFLLETKTLPLLMEDMFDEGPSIEGVKAHARSHRRSSKIYWMTLAQAAIPRRPQLAETAICRAEETGAPPRKIKNLRELIAQTELSQPSMA